MPGSNTVKMAPQAVPSCGGIVSMAPVTVQKNQLPFSGIQNLSVRFQAQCPFPDIHQQETVKGLPGKTVSRQIGEMPAL